VQPLPESVEEFRRALSAHARVTELWVAGSLATGDYVPGVSDVDLVAVCDGPLGPDRIEALTELHRVLDRGVAAGADLGCVYVEEARLAELGALHSTWTHGGWVDRILSGITRAELVLHGFEVMGRPPRDVLPPMTADDVRNAARDEVCGYWAWAARRPRMWLGPVIADLGLTSMARGRHAIRTGRLLTKSEAIAQSGAPAWLVAELAARRRGEMAVSPRLRTAWIAWRDARRTVKWAKHRR
jgi:predicted nucleotidyltransferase